MYVIDPTFSVYHMIERIERKSILFNHRRAMSLISYEIENATLLDGAKTRVFAGFQYLSKFLPQVKRYERLAANAESIYVFAVPDVQPPEIDNIHYIDLKPSDQLAKEWFVISNGVTYSSALATEEISQFTDPDDQRQFKGIWTFDLSIVAIMHDWLGSLVDARPFTNDPDSHNFDEQRAIIAHSFERLNTKIGALSDAALTQGELLKAMQNSAP